MRAEARQSGLTLTEQVVVVAVVATLIYLSLPAVRSFVSSLETSGGARAMISSALASARAIAAKEQRYAGVRFQHAYHEDGPLKAPQYMILIIHDFDNTKLEKGFRAVEGIEPVKLPENLGVMDLRSRIDLLDEKDSSDKPVDSDTLISDPSVFRDTTTFSVIFSPAGKLVVHEVRVRNRDGRTLNSSKDDIFNTEDNVRDMKIAMFYQDDYANLGLGQEKSRNSFLIYEKDKFQQAYQVGQAYSEYLKDLKNSEAMVYINPYTGTMIKSK